MAKPTEDYTWAEAPTFGELKPGPEGGSPTQVLNKEEPDVGIKQSGIVVNGKFARGNLNYILNAIQVHLDYLYEQEVGDIYTTTNLSTTVATVEARFGNTWTERSNDTIGGQTVKVFERTA